MLLVMSMENIGMIDRMIRFIIAIVFIIVGFTYSPWWFIVAAAALITALVGTCGLYSLLGIRTNKEEKSIPKKTASKIAKKRKR
jgi:hypothetical protein